MRRIQRNIAVIAALAVLCTGIPAANAQEVPALGAPSATVLSAPEQSAATAGAVGSTTGVSLAVLCTGIPAANAQEVPALGAPSATVLSAPEQSAATAGAVGSTTGVSLGEGGTTVFTRDTVDQRAVYADALNGVVAWRKDALSDANIKLPYDGTHLTMPAYLKAIGMTESEYLRPQWSNALELIALQRAVEAYDYGLAHTRPNGVPAYLKAIGMTESEYLRPQWSNALELIALQRAVEAYDYGLAHTRPNGDSCWTAQYRDIGSWGEILAWGPPTIRSAVDAWASEKADYLKELNNELHGPTGHYVALITPENRYYGFAGASASTYGSVWSGEMSATLQGTQTATNGPTGHYVALITPENRYYGFAGASASTYGSVWSGEMSATLQGTQTATNLKGTYEFSVNVSADKLAQGVSVELPGQLKMGQQAQAKAKLAYMGGRYELRGGWSSSNPAVLSVDANGTVTAHNEGTARITISAQGQSFSTNVQVSAVSLAFDANGGSGSTQAVKGAAGAKVTVPANAFSRVGHTFTGWNTKANGAGTAYKPGEQYTLGSSDATLYAQWELNTYTVQFDGNGASTSVGPVKVQHGKTIAQPQTPTNIGRAFAGWYTARTGGSRFDFKTPVTGDMTLYARWNNMVFADVRQGDTPGRAFAGWYTARTGGSRFDFKTPVTGDMTLYARWNNMVFADVRQGDTPSCSRHPVACRQRHLRRVARIERHLYVPRYESGRAAGYGCVFEASGRCGGQIGRRQAEDRFHRRDHEHAAQGGSGMARWFGHQ